MMRLRNSIQPLERWIDQFQFSGRRLISNEEKEFLSSQLVDSIKPLNCLAIGVCALLSFCLFSLCAVGRLDHQFFGPLLVISTLISAIVPVEWNRQMRSYRENLSDIQIGEVEIFRTPLTSTEDSSIVFLPRSRRLLRSQGKLINRRIYLKVNSVALPPNLVATPFPSQFALAENHLTVVRILSNYEKRELAALLPKNHTWKWLLPIILWSWSLVGIGFMVQFGFSYLNLVRTVFLALAAIALTIYYAYRHRRLAVVERDLRRGAVICEQSGSYSFEHLFGSALLWTVDSAPASWRKRTTASWFCPTI